MQRLLGTKHLIKSYKEICYQNINVILLLLFVSVVSDVSVYKESISISIKILLTSSVHSRSLRNIECMVTVLQRSLELLRGSFSYLAANIINQFIG